MLFYISECIYL